MGILVYGHRGASAYAPENTLIAFQKAIDMKADGVELDIQLTKDGEIVVIHDESIDRTSNGHGYIKDMTLAELKQYNYNKTHPEYEHADIPTMREVFALIQPTNLIINIELKTGIFFYPSLEEKILALTKEFGMEERVIYSSFNHYSMKKIHELKPDAKVAFLYMDGPIDMPQYAKKHEMNAIHPALYNLQYENVVRDAKMLGLAINVWTVNDDPYIRMCANAQVDGIITNKPDLVREILNEMSK